MLAKVRKARKADLTRWPGYRHPLDTHKDQSPVSGATKPVVARENRPPTACQRFLHVIGSL